MFPADRRYVSALLVATSVAAAVGSSCLVDIPSLHSQPGAASDASTPEAGTDGSTDVAVEAETSADALPESGVDASETGADAEAGLDAGPDGPECNDGGVACGSDCVDLSSDSKNCGRCDHDCMDGACSNGMCQPVLLANNILRPFGIVKDEDFVYGTGDASSPQSNGQVWKVPVNGCSNPSNCAAIISASGSKYQDIAIDAEAIYFTDALAGRVGRILKNGSAQCSVAENQTTPHGIAVFGDDVYWTDMGRDMVLRAPKLCQTPVAEEEVFVSGTPTPSILRVDDTGFYWTSDEGQVVSWASLDGSMQEPVWADSDAGPFAFGPALDDTWVYWRDGVENSFTGPGRTVRARKDRTGVFEVLSDDEPIPRYLAVDDKHVYWVSADSLRRVEKDGGTAETLVTSPEYHIGHGIVLDETYVFFCTYAQEGKVYRLAK